MFDVLKGLLGGEQQQDYQDFVNRYSQGHPAEGYSDQEAVARYQQVAAQAPPELYQQSAEDAFARLSPEERAEFAQFLQQRAQQQGVNVPGLAPASDPAQFQDPRVLAQAATQLHQQQPDLLTQLLGG